MKPLCLIVLLFSSSWQSIGQSRVDFSSMHRFWEIVDLLERDLMPTDMQWASLLETPGYHYLVENERKDTLFKQHFPLVFMPSKRAELEAAQKAGGDRYLNHYLQVAQQRDELIAFQDKLSREDLMKNALQLTASYLPEGLMDKYDGPPPVAFAIFEPDGKANQEIVVVDLYFATLIDLVPFLAHEAHHYYKGQINRLDLPDQDNDDYPFVRAIAQLQTEGIADLIDKRTILDTAARIDSTDSWYERNYKQHVQNASATFARVDTLIQEIAGDPSKKRENGEEIWRSLPFGAHPHGGFMAGLIEDTLGKAVLIATLDNPFAFFESYNQAAQTIASGEHHVFSERTMQYLQGLEASYVLVR